MSVSANVSPEMSQNLDTSTSTRELARILRGPPSQTGTMPESLQWRAFLELRRRGEQVVANTFIQGLRILHRRRTLGGTELTLIDTDPEEHRLAEDPYLGELWKSYKRCLLSHRTGPAAQILRELEQQIC
jgi:hypothetical protein